MSLSEPALLNALTVDVEDYFQVSAFESVVPRARWNEYESRVVASTHRILDILARHGVRGTFFVLGWVARQFPELVREIHLAGHELGSHSYWHRLVYRLTPEEFRQDLRDSVAAIEEATGERVTAYRAPSFSITAQSLWALDILAEEGFNYDSSIYPIHHDRYGIPGADPYMHRCATRTGSLWEFPAAVCRVGRFNVPVSGGGYFRLYPLALTTWALRRLNESEQQPFMVYVHPWEFDPEQPRIRSGSLRTRFRHYVNLRTTEAKFEALVQRFRFAPMREAIQARTHSLPEPQLQTVLG
jgi:polysaccharide deacetylase family protein (PEP-CTERM system associated)